MSWGIRLQGLLKHGRLRPYEILKRELLSGKSPIKLEAGLGLLTNAEQAELITELWDELNTNQQKELAWFCYENRWAELVADYYEQREHEQMRRIEIIGYLKLAESIPFLVKELASKRETKSLTAMSALKKQNPELIIEPMLRALTEPDQWLPARVIEVLRGANRQDLNHSLQATYEHCPAIRATLIEVMGELGDLESLPLLEKALQEREPLFRKKVAEALKKLQLIESWPLLVQLLDDSQWTVRMPAIQALGKIKIPEVKIYLQHQLTVEKDSFLQEMLQETISQYEKEGI